MQFKLHPHSMSCCRLSVIEFFGFPGSGKSTIGDRVATELRRAGRAVYTRRELNDRFRWPAGWRKPLRMLGAGPAAWVMASRALRADPASGGLAYRFRRALQIPRFVVPLEKVQKLDPEAVVVLDEWMLHVFCGAVASRKLEFADAIALLRAYQTTFRPSYVFVDVDRDLAAERVVSRGEKRRQGQGDGWTSYLDHLSLEEVTAEMHGVQEVYSRFTRELRSLGVSVTRVDGKGQPDGSLDEIVRGSGLKLPVTHSLRQAQRR